MRKSTGRLDKTKDDRKGLPRSSTTMGDSEGDAAGKLFIGGVSWQTTEAGLREHFGKFGELLDVALMRNKHTGQPRGFGFVKFKDSASADRVMATSHVMDGRTVDVKRAVPRDKSSSDKSSPTAATATSGSGTTGRTQSSTSTHSPPSSGSVALDRSERGGTAAGASRTAEKRSPAPTASLQRPSSSSSSSKPPAAVEAKCKDQGKIEAGAGDEAGAVPAQARKIFVGGLAPSVGDQDFRDYFEQFGLIADAVVMFDRQTQRSRGFGFVTFEKEQSLDAVFEPSEQPHELKGKVVEVKRAEPKEATAARAAAAALSAGNAVPMVLVPAGPLVVLPTVNNSGAPQSGEAMAGVAGVGEGWADPSKPNLFAMDEAITGGFVPPPAAGNEYMYAAMPLQESMPFPGGTGTAMGYGAHHSVNGYMFVPGVPVGAGAVYASPHNMGGGPLGHAGSFAYAPMPAMYYESLPTGTSSDAGGFDYDRAWYGGDFSMDPNYNQTGYGGFRGQATTHGRLRRKYRPY